MPKTRNRRRKKPRKSVKRNCNPANKDPKIAADSCISQPMIANTPFEGNKSIREVMDECKNDVCIISKITDKSKQTQIENTAFVPKQPREWSLNINEWLSDLEIVKVLKQYVGAYSNFVFYGPSYIDFDTIVDGKCVEEPLCKFSLQDCIRRGKTKIAISLNLDDHTGSGSHWVSLYIDVDDRFIFYFDSAGDGMPKEVRTFVKRVKGQADFRFRVYSNGPFEHQYGTTECGMYSLFFFITMLTNKYEDKVFTDAKHKINFFMRHRITDKFVENKRFEYFFS